MALNYRVVLHGFYYGEDEEEFRNTFYFNQRNEAFHFIEEKYKEHEARVLQKFKEVRFGCEIEVFEFQASSSSSYSS